MTNREQITTGGLMGLVTGVLVRDLDLSSLVSFWGDRSFLLPMVLKRSKCSKLLPSLI